MAASSLLGHTLTDDQLETIVESAKQWALLHGVAMRPVGEPDSTSRVEFAPMTLFPSLVHEAILEEALDLQVHYNRLMHRVAHNHDFLHHALKNVIEVDDFTKMLWDIYTTVRNEGLAQPVSLGLFRNDYMLDVRDSCCNIRGLPASVKLKQIEFNTISAGFAGLASSMWQVHRYTLSLAGVDFSPQQVPPNNPSAGMAAGLVKAWQIYGNKRAIILFVVEAGERNTLDQKWLERAVFDQACHIRVVFVTLQQAAKLCSLTPDRRLMLKDQEVAVVYLRVGYAPHQYPTKTETEIRLMMERSRAIKCPSVHYQLAGCKKIQQVLAAPGSLEMFIDDPKVVARIRDTFAGQYSLDKGVEGDKAIAMAMKCPCNFVLKPQREGGGNNLYDGDIPTFLEKIGQSEERSAYILMDRIFPWPQRNHLLKTGHGWTARDVISELGIFGAFIGSAKEELYNEEVGHLLRTKPNTENEGGIVAGFATMDTPFLIANPPTILNNLDCCS